MNRKISAQHSALAAVLVPVVAGVTGYGIAHAGGSTAPAVRRAAPVTQQMASVTGAWVYKDALTVETLHLKVDSKGSVSGTGDSTVKSNKDPRQSGRFTINVHDGRLRNTTLTLSLDVQRLFGNYLTIAENLRCATAARVLHCRMNAPLYPTVANIPQDFYRR